MSSLPPLVRQLVRCLFRLPALLCFVLLLPVAVAQAQPYLYRADGVQGAQLFSDLSFLLGVEVKDKGSGVARRRLVGEFQGNTRRTFLNSLASAGRFAWATHKNTLTLASRTSLQTRTYRFVSTEEVSSFWTRLQRERIAAGPLIVTLLRGAPRADAGARATSGGQKPESSAEQKDVSYDIQAIAAFHESAQAVYAELSGQDNNRLLSPANSAIYPIAEGRFALMIFRLQYAWANDTPVGDARLGKVLPGVASFMEKIVAARYGASAPRQVAPPTQGGFEHLVSGGLQKIQELGILPAPSSKSSARNPAAAGASAPSASGQPLSVGGSTSPVIFADPRQNAVIIFDERARYDDYRRLVAELDSRTRLVKIEAAIVDISKSRISDLGIQWQGSYDGYQGSFGSLSQGAAEGALAVATQGWSLATNAVVSNVNGLIARINLLESQGKGRVVSRPSILTLDNIEAALTSSQKFFVKVEAFQDSSLYPVEVGTTLRVTPHIIREGQKTRIKLLVVIEDGSIDQTASSDVGGLPRITTNTLTTQAEILETQALVVGGHIRSELQVRWRRVPILGYIPLLGLPFKHRTKHRQEFVRLYIIRPRLTLPADDMLQEEALTEDGNLFAYPKMLQKDREKAEKLARKRERKAAKRERKAAKRAEKQRAKAERQRQRTLQKQQQEPSEQGAQEEAQEGAQEEAQEEAQENAEAES